MPAGPNLMVALGAFQQKAQDDRACAQHGERRGECLKTCFPNRKRDEGDPNNDQDRTAVDPEPMSDDPAYLGHRAWTLQLPAALRFPPLLYPSR